jgi:hypothetical protein
MPSISQLLMPSISNYLMLSITILIAFVFQNALLKIWVTNYPQVKIPVNSRFSKCDDCSQFKLQLGHFETSPRELDILKGWKNQHLDLVHGERLQFNHHKVKAAYYPKKVATFILDGMSSNMASLPLFLNPRRKMGDHCTFCDLHLVGLIDHKHSELKNVFLSPESSRQDPNLTITAILYGLFHLTTWPEKLYLQMDNCWRENKNKYVFGFAAWLVFARAFHKVKVSFLIKGHTHENVDRMFSLISKRLVHDSPKTITEFINTIHSAIANNGDLNVRSMDAIFDGKAFLEPYLEDLHGHTEPHHFVFYRDDQGGVVMKCKKYKFTKYSNPVRIFRTDPPTTLTFRSAPLKLVNWQEKHHAFNRCKSALTTLQQSEWQQWFDQHEESVPAPVLSHEVINKLNQKCGIAIPIFRNPSRPPRLLPSITEATSADLPNVLELVAPFLCPSTSDHTLSPSQSSVPETAITLRAAVEWQSEVDNDVVPDVYSGPYKEKPMWGDVCNDIKIGDMFLVLREKREQQEEPFWMGQVTQILKERKKLGVLWYGKTSQTSWESASWGEWYNELTDEVWANMTPEEQNKNKSKRGTLFEKSTDMIDLDPDTILFYGFRLNSFRKIPAKDVKNIQLRIAAACSSQRN